MLLKKTICELDGVRKPRPSDNLLGGDSTCVLHPMDTDHCVWVAACLVPVCEDTDCLTLYFGSLLLLTYPDYKWTWAVRDT